MRLQPRSKDFGRALNILLDQMIGAINTMNVKAPAPVGIRDRILNDGDSAVKSGMLYGRDSDGRVTAAMASALNVAPIWLSVSLASTGQAFEALVVGRARIRLEDPEDRPSAAGEMAWLSQTTAGTVTPTIPTSGYRYMCGRFAGTRVASDGTVEIDLFIFPQSGGLL